MRWVACLLSFVSILSSAAFAQKKALDHDAYDIWKNIDGEKIANNGKWVLYSLQAQDGDPELFVESLGSDTLYRIEGGAGAEFTFNTTHVVFAIAPQKADMRAAKRNEVKDDEQPKNDLGILDLATGVLTRIDRVKSFKLPKEGMSLVAYLMEKPLKSNEDKNDEEENPEEAGETPESTAEKEKKLTEEEKKAERKKKRKEEAKPEGTELVLRVLATGVEQRFAGVNDYAFSKYGSHLAYATSTKKGETDGAWAVDVDDGDIYEMLTGTGIYKGLALDDEGTQVAFLANRDTYETDQPAFTLYHFPLATLNARPVVAEGSPGIDAGWWVSEHRVPEFSESGQRLFFGTAPRPEPGPEEPPLKDDEVRVDVWNWKDTRLQPMQLVDLKKDQERSYLAAVTPIDGRIVQLGALRVPDVATLDHGNAAFALGVSPLPYLLEGSWDSPDRQDIYAIRVATGARLKIAENIPWEAKPSPLGQYCAWWDGAQKAWFAASLDSGAIVNLSGAIPHRLENELHDLPAIPGPHGMAGWTTGDKAALIYDRHDVWMCDPQGLRAATCVTNGLGRGQNLKFRVVDADPDEEAISGDAPLLLAAFDYATKAAGFYRGELKAGLSPNPLLMDDRHFSPPKKAKHADTLLYTRESFEEFPDLWVSDTSLGGAHRISDANPQQAEYRWGKGELVHWTSAEGAPLDGLLYTPDDFDPAKKYPMIVYFYERLSDTLHRHTPPQAVRASIVYSFYVSRGYVVFVPDIPYELGRPGESALHAIVPGVLHLMEKGFVDEKRIGIQGHSWGGYQAAYMITRTNLFAAAEAGAPVANMTSAYGGIRWETGRSRMFQYEKTQSRIGGTLWQDPLHYIDNSPLFRADQIETPLLMMHNDKDGAVPWYQGIEMFTALRRLGRPVWMLNYNDEDHGLKRYPNMRDWAIRMQQFFDHFLKDAPEPVWMRDGVPAVEKGKMTGLELAR